MSMMNENIDTAKTLHLVSRAVKAIVVAAALVAALLLSGCGSSSSTTIPSEPHDTVVVLGEHANAVAINRDTYSDEFKEIEHSVALSLVSGGDIKVFSLDGAPCLIDDLSDTAKESYAVYKKKTDADFLMARAKSIAADLMDAAIERSAARVPEVDTLDALKLAGNECSKSDANDTVALYVIDSGVATKNQSVCDFTRTDMNTVDIAAFVAKLKSDGALPGLANVDEMRWYGLGSVAAPQEALSYQQEDRLKDIYSACIAAGGYNGDIAKVFATRSRTTSDTTVDGLPSVSTIRYAVSISDDKVGFVPDSDSFIDPATAHKELDDVANELLKNPGQKIAITGCTAHYGSAEDCRDLGYRRAIAVRNALIDGFGVPSDQIPLDAVIGAGYESKYTTWDADGDGTYSDAEAQADRKIVIESIR